MESVSGSDVHDATILPSAVPKERYAITVRHAHKQYSDVFKILTSGATVPNFVLRDFNMTVEKGHIYALLGASGCGKTTILRAIVGQHNLTSGEIRVLGQLVGNKEGSSTSWAPGATIGYMPQEVSLLEKFTIKEIFYYYGQLVGMDNDSIKIETDKLVRLLDLPDMGREVWCLSGGQQRRVSFAIALLHNPPVLVMDEPTVGLDPLLRESIWHYLKSVVQRNGTTVIITTHYMAEATKADTVGLMRHGKLMAEQSPHSLIESCGGQDLEAVLLKLCLLQSSKQGLISSVYNDTKEEAVFPVNESDVTHEMVRVPSRKVSPFNRIWALIWKDLIWLQRNKIYSLSLMLLPIIIMFGVFFTTRMPTGMSVSVYNQDADCFSEGYPTTNFLNEAFNCSSSTNLSCYILQHIQNSGLLLVASKTEESAEDDVRRGRSWAAVTFAKNFSSALIQRIEASSPSDVTEAIVDMGSIYVVMDQSDRVISFSIQEDLNNAIVSLLSDYDNTCHTLRARNKVPMQFYPPVYGYDNTTNTDYVYPSVITALSFVLPVTAILCALLPAKLEGTLERSMVSGVTMHELTAALVIVYLPLSIAQYFIMLLIPYKILNFYFAGSIWISAVLLTYLGIAGIIMGFLLAILCPNIFVGASTAMGLYFIFLFTGGLAWPLEGVVSPMREFCYSMPLTYPSEALRHIVQRGWTFLHRTPQLAMLSTTVWILIFLVVLLISLKYHTMYRQ